MTGLIFVNNFEAEKCSRCPQIEGDKYDAIELIPLTPQI